MIGIYRHGRSAPPGEELETRVEAFLFFHERLGTELGQCIECMRAIAPDRQESTRDCHTALERVADCWKQLQSGGEVKDLEGQLEQLRLAADCLKNAVELTPGNPLMEALEHGIPEIGMQFATPPQLFSPRSGQEQPLRPRWDGERRVLYLGNRELTRYKRHPAKNQIDLLEAFENEGWPTTIPDPFRCKQVLRQTMRDLNRKLPKGTVRFRGDGSGDGVTWEIAE